MTTQGCNPGESFDASESPDRGDLAKPLAGIALGASSLNDIRTINQKSDSTDANLLPVTRLQITGLDSANDAAPLPPSSRKPTDSKTVPEERTPEQNVLEKLTRITDKIGGGFKIIESPRELTETENAAKSSIINSIKGNDPEALKEALTTLAKHPEMTKPVLDAVKREFEYETYDRHRSLSWERGTNDKGENFVRLNLSLGSFARGGHSTHISIGSDGTSSATERWAGPSVEESSKVLDTKKALSHVNWEPHEEEKIPVYEWKRR